MEENQTSTSKVSIKYGIISGLAGIAFFVLVDMLGFSGNQSIQYLGYLVMAGIIYLAHKAYK